MKLLSVILLFYVVSSDKTQSMTRGTEEAAHGKKKTKKKTYTFFRKTAELEEKGRV